MEPGINEETRAGAGSLAAMILQGGDDQAKWGVKLAEDGGYHVERLWRGVTDHHMIEKKFLLSAEARKLHRLTSEHAISYATPAQLVNSKADDDEDGSAGVRITRPSELLDAILAAGRKGLNFQRYKGLGEMNSEQLWETTLDPEVRSLLQVTVEQADVTDDIFTKLMGEVVEPRREFIVDNALNVANLDV